MSDKFKTHNRLAIEAFRRCASQGSHKRNVPEGMRVIDTEAQFLLARGWLIERARVRRLRDLLDESTGGPFDMTKADLMAALREARVHVYRQTTGRHEQDRQDAHDWLDRWGQFDA